jgi:hypothetical protein
VEPDLRSECLRKITARLEVTAAQNRAKLFPLQHPNPQDRHPGAAAPIAAEFRNLQKPLDTIAAAISGIEKTGETMAQCLCAILAITEVSTGLHAFKAKPAPQPGIIIPPPNNGTSNLILP